MIILLRQLNRSLERQAGKIFIAGLGLVLFRNWRQWQRDKVLVVELQKEHRQLPALSHTPKVSVLVAAWNAHNHLTPHLESFLKLTYPEIELVLCAGGADDTLEVAYRYVGARVKVLEQLPGEGKQRALAKAYALAEGEIIYLTDADCIFEQSALIRLLAPIINGGEQVTTGSMRPLAEQQPQFLPAYLGAVDMAANLYSPAYVTGILGANTAVTRQALEGSGGLDFDAPTGTDYHLGKRLGRGGYKIRLVKSSVVATSYPDGLKAYRRRQSRWLRNLVLYGKQYGAEKDLRQSYQTIVIGAVMSFLPVFGPFLGNKILSGWGILFAQAVVSKVRYNLLTARLTSRPVPLKLWLGLLPMTQIDFNIWALPALDLLASRKKIRW